MKRVNEKTVSIPLNRVIHVISTTITIPGQHWVSIPLNRVIHVIYRELKKHIKQVSIPLNRVIHVIL